MTLRENFGGDYARDAGWSGGGRAGDFVREAPLPTDEHIRDLVNERLTDHDDVDATGLTIADHD